MRRNRRKIILAVLAAVIGLLAVLLLAAWTCFLILDKTNATVVSSGLPRRYLLYVPRTYDRTKPTPLVISLHPAATWPAVERATSRWNDVAEEHSFIVVYPEGTGAFFGGLRPGPQVFPMGTRSLKRDVQFISDLIAKLEAEYNIDPNRIYADGMSNGGGMAFALSCRLSDRIVAVGAMAAAQTLEWDRCGISRPVPTVAFRGTDDRAAPYQGGASPVAPGVLPNIQEWAAPVARRNHCQEEPTGTRISPNVRRLAYTNCADNADVVLYTIEGGGHTWPGDKPLPGWIVRRTTREINASSVMWEFFV